MFPHYTLAHWGKLKVRIYCEVQQINLKIVSHLTKKWNFKVVMQLKRYCQIDTLQHFARNVRHSQPHMSKDVDATVWLRSALSITRCSRRSQSHIPQRCAVATRPLFGFSDCKPAAEEGPISCNWPGWGLDNLKAKGQSDGGRKCLELEQIDRLLCAVKNNKLWRNFCLTSSFAKNIKHVTYFKIANQQHQQNPVNELSCTNLYALVCFLRTILFYGTRCIFHAIACLLAKCDHDTDGDYFGFQDSPKKAEQTLHAVSLSLCTNKYELLN